MEKLKAKLDTFRFKGILAIVLVFALITVLLFVELSGVQYRYAQNALDLLPDDRVVTKAQSYVAKEKDTLLLYSLEDSVSVLAYEQFDVILLDMRVGADVVELSNGTPIPDFSNYSVVIVLLSDLSHLGQTLIPLCDWVYDGGQVLFPLTLDKNPYSSAIENKIGVEASYGYSHVDKFYINEDFMIGGGRAFEVPDSYESARTVQLNPKTTRVYAAIGKPGGVPLVWEADYGNGKFVVDNFGLYDKAYRGFFAASLSLLTPVYLYPVINGSVFYLDDFPSQIPEGTNEYILRDYQTTTRDFYVNIWWPDMMNFSDKYGIKFTGLAIASYDDDVDGRTDAQVDTGTFMTFGNMLLRKGGEIGYHGYNHQPLAIGRDYKGIYEYKSWNDEEAMKTAFTFLTDLCDELFPGVTLAVYVPPSNLLAPEGRAMLLREFKQIRTLSGIYLPDDKLDFSLLQEFEVDANGIVDQPRIISGCSLDDFMVIAAVSELNLHYVNDHFTHPDDALDPERGALIGWAELCRSFDGFLNWLYTSAPNIRNFTGTELSAAVQRFAAVVPRMEVGSESMQITIDNFYDDAQFLVRFNERQPDRVEGGRLTRLAGNLYSLEATEAVVTISFK